MQKINSLHGIWQRNAAFFLSALLVLTADQLSKLWTRSNLATGESLPETGFFRLTHVHNTGAAFGLFQDQTSLLTFVAFIGIAVLLVFALFMYRRLPFLNNMPGKMSLGLVLGGTVGNLIDRLSSGYVTDFIDIGIWPAFNIADSAITVGVFIFAYSLLRSLGRERKTT